MMNNNFFYQNLILIHYFKNIFHIQNKIFLLILREKNSKNHIEHKINKI
jgi:hypothetical protein